MAREKGTGSLQQEKSGRYTARISVGGVRMSRSTHTRNRKRAEAFLLRMLAPYGRGEKIVPFADVWMQYERSLLRRELATTTLRAKKNTWLQFAAWIDENHPEVTQLKFLLPEMVAEYLRVIRSGISACTYNNRICVLREIYRVLAEEAGIKDDPWKGVKLLDDDSHARREFTRKELARILGAAEGAGKTWKILFCLGMYTGLRLGDCCLLEWGAVNFERGIIQVIPRKTRRHAHGVPVTIPIHPELMELLKSVTEDDERFVLPTLAGWYQGAEHWRIGYGLEQIFRAAGVVTSVRIDGRKTATPDATFHSLRHTFVSFSANAGVPLPVVQSIVGHSSTAMTRHYYHENEEVLRRAVASVPGLTELRGGASIGTLPLSADAGMRRPPSVPVRSVAERLKELEGLLSDKLVTRAEYRAARARILGEI